MSTKHLLGIAALLLLLRPVHVAALLGDWAFCETNSQCANSCCSKQYSNDGKYKCTPGGTASQCTGSSASSLLGAWAFCTSNSQCANACCSKQYSGDGKFKCTPGGTISQCTGSTTTTKKATTTTKKVTTTTTKKATTTTTAASVAKGSCSSPVVRLTEVNAGTTISVNEDEVALKPLAIAPIPSGGSRVAFMGSDGKAHVITLNADDTINSKVSTVAINVHDFGDIYADNAGFVILGTRDAKGGGTLNCGNPSNLCGTAPSPAVPCYDMYLIRYDYATGKETWATKLTDSSSSLPPYSTSATGPNVFFIWWYAHHGRISFDGKNYAAYFGAAISVSQSGCINIHQGDRMQVVSSTGSLLSGHNSFDWGCSHSGYERILWDSRTSEFITVCKTDNANRLTFAPSMTPTIRAVDLSYSNLGNIVVSSGAGYWLTVSDIRSGQTANSNGLADVHLVHFTKTAGSDKDIVLASTSGVNDRAPHLAKYGSANLLAAWETSSAKGDLVEGESSRRLVIQVRNASTGAAVSSVITVNAVGNRYQEFKSFPDGSVGYASKTSSNTKVKIVRVLPCA